MEHCKQHWMLNTPIFRLILSCSLPILPAVFLLSAYDLFETGLIARLCSTHLAALSFSAPITTAMTGVAIALSIATNSWICRIKSSVNTNSCITDKNELKSNVVRALVLATTITFIFSMLLYFISPTLYFLLGTQSSSQPAIEFGMTSLVTTYTEIRLISWIPLILVWQINGILRSFGHIKQASILLVTWMITKSVLSYSLIGDGQCSQLLETGIIGAGYAHLISDTLFALISLGIINEAMRSSAQLNIQYAAKQSRISNAWKKYKGQILGLEKTDAMAKKLAVEKAFNNAVNSNQDFKKYQGVLDAYATEYKNFKTYSLARSMYIEVFYYGPEILRFSQRFRKLSDETIPLEERIELIEKLKESSEAYFEDFDAGVDEKLMAQMIPEYLVSITTSLVPSTVYHMFGTNTPLQAQKTSSQVYENSIFSNKESLFKFLDTYGKKSAGKMKKDPAFVISTDLQATYGRVVSPFYKKGGAQVDSIQRVYMAGLMAVLPNYKNYYPDANFSLRLSYGKVTGSEPVDGMVYKYYTTMEGIAQKRDTDSYEFNVPQKLMDLYEAKDFGAYADSNNRMHVCYTATNHTTGGNSGSPALNAKGELVGLNFDRTWESTMSDIMYDPEICRNIMVDIRYVLFIVDKYAGAGHLVKEMDLVK